MEMEIVNAPRPSRTVAHGEAIPRWSNASRLALGAWTLSMPLAALSIAITAVVTEPNLPGAVFVATYALLVVHFILMLFYLAFASQNPRLGRAHAAWLFALVVAGPVFILVYWVIHVWNAPRVGRVGIDEEVPGFDEADARAAGALG